MDPPSPSLPEMPSPDSPIVVTGAGSCDLASEPDATPFLRTRKMRKLVGPWDRMAIVAAAQALEQAGLEAPLGPTAGLYTCVGHVPLKAPIMDSLLEDSTDEQGRFRDALYAKGGYFNFNPFWTFGSLTNAPAFFVSSCFDVQGPYFVTFAETGEFYLALEEAIRSLRDGDCRLALVVGVADQDNDMVRFHFERIQRPVPAERLRSGAGVLVLETAEAAAARGAAPRARLAELAIDYTPFDPLLEEPEFDERFEPPGPCSDAYWGPSSLPMSLAAAAPGELRHQADTRTGIRVRSRWEVLA
ncbi:MAG: hypothetical protein D6702_02920 [Planctomycetota bacterium]|nr:MAG: hypothetical protein D6702_02920 [Planctomycetota bacterium]